MRKYHGGIYWNNYIWVEYRWNILSYNFIVGVGNFFYVPPLCYECHSKRELLPMYMNINLEFFGTSEKNNINKGRYLSY